MAEFFTIDGNRIKAAEADFNFVAFLEENNVPVMDIQKKPLSTAKLYVAYCLGADPEIAGNLINNHIIGGGDITDLMNMIAKKVDESGFFRALQERATENLESSENESEATEKVTKMPRKKTSDPQD